jgi:hypothetical protein
MKIAEMVRPRIVMLPAAQDHRHALAGRDQSEGTVSEVQRENEGWFQNKAPFNSVEPSSVHGCTCQENTNGTRAAFL